MEWTTENIEMLNTLWKEGMTARQIASQLGHGVTRNAVIGKAHRLGLSQRPAMVHKRETSYAAPSLGTLKNCQWPFGDPQHDSFHYCGDKVVEGKPYCSTHCAVAYRHADDDVAAATKALNASRAKQALQNA